MSWPNQQMSECLALIFDLFLSRYLHYMYYKANLFVEGPDFKSFSFVSSSPKHIGGRPSHDILVLLSKPILNLMPLRAHF
jgi:hypothetical protein